jgi:hypothetical protein
VLRDVIAAKRKNMNNPIPERDWKYLRSVENELIASLCKRINQRTVGILNAHHQSEHEKYLKVFHHIEGSDNIVAECFNDWRRSNIRQKLICLHRHNLLTDEHLRNMTEETQDFVKWSETL